MGGFELPVEVVVLVLHALGLDLRLQRPSHRVVRGSTARVEGAADPLSFSSGCTERS